MVRKTATVCLSVVVLALSAVNASAQDAMKVWFVNASAGLSLTSGNTDTSTVNAAYDVVYDPHTKNVVKSEGLLIKGTTNSVPSTSRLSLSGRDEYTLTGRTIVYGQNQFLKDRFKNIDYLVAPTGGFGYKLIDSMDTKLGIDGGLGGVWEKNPGVAVKSSAAVTAGQKLVSAITPTATFTQSFTALWKTNDFDDALYTAGVGIAASMSARTQLKVEFLETYKNKPPSAAVEKSDIAVLMAIVFKM